MKKLKFTHAIRKKQGKKFTCNVTQWYIHIITVALEMQQCVLCTVEINMSLSTI